jgi:hypothetical protein
MELLLLAQLAQPVPKLGRCPLGYYTQGSYCVPALPAQQAVSRDGSCPFGWYQAGSYCVRSR